MDTERQGGAGARGHGLRAPRPCEATPTAMLEGVLDLGRGGTFQSRTERDVIVRTSLARLDQLDIGDQALSFGRIDRVRDAGEHDPDRMTRPAAATGGLRRGTGTADIETFHIGRLGIHGADHEPLVVDWRAPVAEPFYRATGRDPKGLVLRRHLALEGRRIVGIEDERFGAPGPGARRRSTDLPPDGRPRDGGDGGDRGELIVGDLPIGGPAALLAALDRARSGRMTDIVSTIQRSRTRSSGPRCRRAGGPGRSGHGQDGGGPPPGRLPPLYPPVPPRAPGRAGGRAQPALPPLHRAGPALAGGDRRDPVHRLGPGPRDPGPGERPGRGGPAEGRRPHGQGRGPRRADPPAARWPTTSPSPTARCPAPHRRGQRGRSSTRSGAGPEPTTPAAAWSSRRWPSCWPTGPARPSRRLGVGSPGPGRPPSPATTTPRSWPTTSSTSRTSPARSGGCPSWPRPSTGCGRGSPPTSCSTTCSAPARCRRGVRGACCRPRSRTSSTGPGRRRSTRWPGRRPTPPWSTRPAICSGPERQRRGRRRAQVRAHRGRRGAGPLTHAAADARPPLAVGLDDRGRRHRPGHRAVGARARGRTSPPTSPRRRPVRTVELTVSYRTPAEVLAVAGRVLAVAAPELVPPRPVRRTGVEPRMVAVRGTQRRRRTGCRRGDLARPVAAVAGRGGGRGRARPGGRPRSRGSCSPSVGGAGRRRAPGGRRPGHAQAAGCPSRWCCWPPTRPTGSSSTPWWWSSRASSPGKRPRACARCTWR